MAKKIKVLSKIYKNQKIQFNKDLVIEFEDGVAEVEESVFKEIEKTNFPNIFSEESGIPQEKNFTEKDADKAILEVKDQLETEIDRLKNIVKAKDDEIKGLKEEVKNWKKEVEKLKKPSNKKDITIPTEEDKEIATLRADLEKVSFEELKNLAIEEGMVQEEVEKFEDESNKNDLIESLISFYKKSK